MKIYLDDELVFELTETQQKVIQNDIPEEEFVNDIKRRLKWVIMDKHDNCLSRLKTEWIPKLIEEGEKSVPLQDMDLAAHIFKNPNYKDRSARDKEQKEKKEHKNKP